MATSGRVTLLLLATLIAAIFVQPLICIPANKDQETKGSADDFANQAADMLDSTLLFFKDGINNFIQDSTYLSNMVSNLTDNIIKIAPQGEVRDTEQSQKRLHQLSVQANRSLSEGLFQMDD